MNPTPGKGILIEPVAVVRSPFEEKFGVPRQPGLVPRAHGEIRLLEPYRDPSMLHGLEGFSHVWLTFRFDRCVNRGWGPTVRPPRLGGNAEVGVWASRSPFRPNFLGLSVVRLLEVVPGPDPLLHVAGIDLLDGTEVFDIKPYLPYVDAVVDARAGFAPVAPTATLSVVFSSGAEQDLASLTDPPGMRALVAELLALDPRPAYRRGAEPGRVYGMHLAGRNVRWRVTGPEIEVLDLKPAGSA